MIYMSPTSQYVTYTYTTQQLDPILHTKHDATLCECIFYHRKCIFEFHSCLLLRLYYIYAVDYNYKYMYMRWLV